MKDTIEFSQMLSEIDALTEKGEPKPFSLVFVTADLKRQTGGEIHIISNRTVKMDLLCRQCKDAIFTESKVVKVVGKTSDKVPIFIAQSSQTAKRNPHHHKNRTLNIMILSSKEVRKVHPRLIKFFNDKEIN